MILPGCAVAVRRCILAVCFVAMAGGCATATSPVFPLPPNGLPVSIIPFAPAFDDVPPGTYRVANTSFAVKKHKPLSAAGAALDALGVLGHKAAGKDESREIGEVLAPYLDLNVAGVLLQRFMAELDAAPVSMTLRLSLRRPPSEGPLLELRPWVLISSDDGQWGRLYCYVRARLVDRRGRQQWWTRYSYYLPQYRPLTGHGSWTADGARALHAALIEAYDELSRLVLRDLRGVDAGWTARAATLLIEEPGLGARREVDALILSESGDSLVLTPKVKQSDRLFGINLVSRGDVRILAAE